MKKIITLSVLAILTASLYAQNYDFNSYKYRFQKVRGFGVSGNSNSTGGNDNVYDYYLNNWYSQNNGIYRNFNRVADTGDITSNIIKNNAFGIYAKGNLSYFHDINTNNLQQSVRVNFSSKLRLNNGKTSKNENNPSKTVRNTNEKQSNAYNYFGNNLDFTINNRFYNNSKNFVYINSQNRISISNNNSHKIYTERGTFDFTDTAFLKIDGKRQVKTNNQNGSFDLEIGFGNGRLENVTDPIMAVFLLKDLIQKTNIDVPSSKQIENIAKGITKIRNTRFLDFRFRLIDQIDMLDKVLKENGVETDQLSRYYTTLNDNWNYATSFYRESGKRMSLFAKSNYYFGNNYNGIYHNNLHVSNFTKDRSFIDVKNKKRFSSIFNNGVGMDYTISKQKGLRVQKSKGFNLFLYHNFFNLKDIYNDSIGNPGYRNTKYALKNQSSNIRLQGFWSYLFQPNTRTYFEFNMMPGMVFQNIASETLNSSDTEREALNQNYYIRTSFRYFRFINQRLNFNIELQTYITLENNLLSYYEPNHIRPVKIKDKIFDLQYGYIFNMGVNYFLY